ncbi:hypothetical protein PHSY_005328 [Pseudozyma hubeiensis SY62]|uniref:Uncharacterized protein n=1 Tax=Pseudozyma hubeiensis (strain SY62) TaxID=1305764 RepID=R9P8Q4_PSEHS|nr:hypothetical protein PHSY_005328 [Pseudozyma hubeiensis SY62]GAC97741.1 hypothetical protein PHSY_005328 [Pseudozyma hubeiensis SY62]
MPADSAKAEFRGPADLCRKKPFQTPSSSTSHIPACLVTERSERTNSETSVVPIGGNSCVANTYQPKIWVGCQKEKDTEIGRIRGVGIAIKALNPRGLAVQAKMSCFSLSLKMCAPARMAISYAWNNIQQSLYCHCLAYLPTVDGCRRSTTTGTKNRPGAQCVA